MSTLLTLRHATGFRVTVEANDADEDGRIDARVRIQTPEGNETTIRGRQTQLAKLIDVIDDLRARYHAPDWREE